MLSSSVHVLPFSVELIDICTGFLEVAPLTSIFTLYFDILYFPTRDRKLEKFSPEYFLKIKE